MGKIKQLRDEQAGKVDTKTGEIFPQITSKCKIKQVTLKKGKQDIRFEDFAISSDQMGTLESLIEGQEVYITISAVQGQLLR